MNDRDVFINCPFSPDYAEKFNAIVFAVIRSGFTARCAREIDDGGENRFDKICRIIRECRLGIHDISKTELDADTSLPRFNMPLELGLFLGARKFGGKASKHKRTLILDRESFRYQKFISDIAGQDIHAHDDSADKAIAETVDWLRGQAIVPNVPGGTRVIDEYRKFQIDFPALCERRALVPADVKFPDLLIIVSEWILAQDALTPPPA